MVDLQEYTVVALPCSCRVALWGKVPWALEKTQPRTLSDSAAGRAWEVKLFFLRTGKPAIGRKGGGCRKSRCAEKRDTDNRWKKEEVATAREGNCRFKSVVYVSDKTTIGEVGRDGGGGQVATPEGEQSLPTLAAAVVGQAVQR